MLSFSGLQNITSALYQNLYLLKSYYYEKHGYFTDLSEKRKLILKKQKKSRMIMLSLLTMCWTNPVF